MPVCQVLDGPKIDGKQDGNLAVLVRLDSYSGMYQDVSGFFRRYGPKNHDTGISALGPKIPGPTMPTSRWDSEPTFFGHFWLIRLTCWGKFKSSNPLVFEVFFPIFKMRFLTNQNSD